MKTAVLILATFGFSAWAHAPKFHNPPCMAVTKACEKGGYKEKAKEGEGHLMDCLNQFLGGVDVDGVKMKADDAKVTACKEKVSAWEAAHHHHKSGKVTDNQLHTVPKGQQESGTPSDTE